MSTTLTDNPLQASSAEELTLSSNNLAFHKILMAERPRLVRLSAAILQNREAAEDVAQEALFEAWRSIDKLQNPHALQAWLSGITRNVCARWLRKEGKQPSLIDTAQDEIEVSDDFDLEVELERDELALLLDRALALLPDVTRDVLVQKFVADLPHAAIGEALGLNENAVAARVHRGKLALQTLLKTELRSEAETFGLVEPDDVWRATRIWCTQCGRRRMIGRLDGEEFALRCPNYHPEVNSYHSQDSVDDYSTFKTFRPALNRFHQNMHTFFIRTIQDGGAPCRGCDVWLPLRKGFPPYAPPSIQKKRGLHVYCPSCPSGSYVSIDGQALFDPLGRDFWREERRILTLPEIEIETDGVPALHIPFESVRSRATLDMILHRDTYHLLAIHSDESE